MSLVCSPWAGTHLRSLSCSVHLSYWSLDLLLSGAQETEDRQFVSLTSPISLAQVTGLSPLSLS